LDNPPVRYLVLLLLAIVAVWLVRRALAGKARPGGGEAAPAAQQDLVSCAHCGVHLPRAEARLAGDRVYCGDEHARLGPRQG
jgi:uncharacterized protein